VTPIRPSGLPVHSGPTSVAANGAGAARQAAQKAFFDAAMGRSGGAPAAQAAPAIQTARASDFTVAPAPAQRADIRPNPSTDPPTKVLRPGSLLDIRV
jgi:hypothetical protein